MSLVSRPLDRAALHGTPAGAVLQLGTTLAAVMAAGSACCALAAWNLKALLARYDTLAYLLQEAHAVELARVRSLLFVAGALLLTFGAVSLSSWRAALALSGGGLTLSGLLAASSVGAALAPAAGLEESLIYRLRGFSAIAVIGGAFLLFLSSVPTLLDRRPGRRERSFLDRLGRRLESLVAAPTLRRRLVLGMAVFLLTASVGRLILHDFPNSSDESSYLTQARIFAAGKLWVAAPSEPDFFRARSFIMDTEGGRFFAKAFPGWAAILSLGVRAGIPWAVNPLLSAVTLILAGWAGGRLLGGRGEIGVIGIMLATPFFLFNAASYYNHPATLLLVTLLLAAAIHLTEGGGPSWACLAGVSIGLALWIRPASALMLGLPIGLWLASRWVRGGRWGMLAATAAPILIALAGLAWYNSMMFGSIWQTGYDAYDPGDIRPGLGIDHLSITAWWILKLFFWLIPGMLAGLWFLMSGRDWRRWFQREPLLVLMLVSCAGLLLTYLVFQNKGGNEYGPRYYYDGFAFLAILLAAGWRRAPEVLEGLVPAARVRRGVALVLGFGSVLTIAGSIPFLMFHYHDKIAHNRDLYASVERSGRSSALIFLATGSGRMPPGDLVRNPLDFRSGVVYARDLGPEADRRLASLYPDRPALVYAYDSRARRSTLRPLDAGSER